MNPISDLVDAFYSLETVKISETVEEDFDKVKHDRLR